MPIVSIDAVEAGAVLARPVEDSMGRVLINSGETLTPQLIGVLKKRGFAEVEVRQPQQDTGSLSDEEVGRMTRSFVANMADDQDVIALNQEIEKRFHNINPKNPRMLAIRMAAQKALVTKIAKTKGMA